MHCVNGQPTGRVHRRRRQRQRRRGVEPSVLGAPCSAGCSEGDACAVASTDCSGGLCGADYRSSEPWLGCTATCVPGACPIGWEWVDVVAKTDGTRVCLPSRERIVVDGNFYQWTFSGPMPLKLDTTVPATGDAKGCGKVELLANDASQTTIRLAICGDAPSDGKKVPVLTRFELTVGYGAAATAKLASGWDRVGKPPAALDDVVCGDVGVTAAGARLRTVSVSTERCARPATAARRARSGWP